MTQDKSVTAKCIQEIRVGDTAYAAKTVTEADVMMFAMLSGDYAPQHVSAAFGATMSYHSRIAHGMLTVGLVGPVLNRLCGDASCTAYQKVHFSSAVLLNRYRLCQRHGDSSGPRKAAGHHRSDRGTQRNSGKARSWHRTEGGAPRFCLQCSSRALQYKGRKNTMAEIHKISIYQDIEGTEFPQAAVPAFWWVWTAPCRQSTMWWVPQMSIPGGGVPEHAHETEETYIILSGTGEMIIDGEPVPIKSDDVIYLPPMQRHELKNTGDTEMRTIFVYAPKMVVEHWAQESKGELPMK